MNSSLSIDDYSRIRILEVITVSGGRDLERDSPLAYYPTKIRWCPVDIDMHIVMADEAKFTKVDEIEILSYFSSAIIPGIYDKLPAVTEKELFEFEEEEQAA